MKRATALQGLSRDHHQALAVALRLRRADAGSATEARRGFLDFWREHGAEHSGKAPLIEEAFDAAQLAELAEALSAADRAAAAGG